MTVFQGFPVHPVILEPVFYTVGSEKQYLFSCFVLCNAKQFIQTIKVDEILRTVILLQILSLLTPYRDEQMNTFHIHCYMPIYTYAKQKSIRFQRGELIY